MDPLRNVRTIITSAGDSRGLFLPAGYSAPKSLVVCDGQPVIVHAVSSYAINLEKTSVAINREEDEQWSIGRVLKIEFPDTRVLRVNSGVQGALATAVLALTEITDQPLVVAAGDSRIVGGIKSFVADFIERKLDAATVAFESTSPRWSYIGVDDSGNVRQVAEKEVIGTHATTGVFYFRSARTFLDAATWCFVNNASRNGQFYVSAALNYLVSVGLRVGYSETPSSKYKSWSLPVDFSDVEG